MVLSSILCAFKLEDHMGYLVVHGGFIGLINNSSKVILVYGPIALIEVHLVKVLHAHGISWLEFIGSSLIQWHISFGVRELWCTFKVHFIKSLSIQFHSIKHMIQVYFHFISKSCSFDTYQSSAILNIILIQVITLHFITQKNWHFYLSWLSVNYWISG